MLRLASPARKNLLLFSTYFLLAALLFSVTDPAFAASTKTLKTCSKLGQVKFLKGTRYECIRYGKSLKWMALKSKKPLSPSTETKTVPKPVWIPPVGPTSFDDLYDRRDGISYSAWKTISTSIADSVGKEVPHTVYTGPNTRPYFDNYPQVIDLVTRAFPEYGVPSKVVVIRYSFKDISWAEELLKSLVSPSEFSRLSRFDSTNVVQGRCQPDKHTCVGSTAPHTSEGFDLILQGVPTPLEGNDVQRTRMTTGQLEAHEFFHLIQRTVSPHRWSVEGAAEWVQNATINHSSFEDYLRWQRGDCDTSCRKLTSEEIQEYLELDPEVVSNKYEPFLAYSLGSRVMEIFVALKGKEVFTLMAERRNLSFDEAFARVFSYDWRRAVPLIAKTIAANFASGL